MHPNDEHFFVVRAVEDANASSLGQVPCRFPQKIVIQILGTRVLEAENLATLRIHAGHHVFDDAVFACGVHRLKDQQQ